MDEVDDDRVPNGTRDRLRRLEQAFECVWCSGREQDVLPFAARLGFGTDWPVIRFGAGSARDLDWKLRQVRRWCAEHAEGRRVAWVDDDLRADAQAWAEGARARSSSGPDRPWV